MFTITNIEEINKVFGRNLGTKTIIDVSNIVKTSISAQYVFVRYMGPKFAIAFSGVEINGVAEFLNDLKEKLERTKITIKICNNFL